MNMARRLRHPLRLVLLASALAALPGITRAGIFDDEEARAEIARVRKDLGKEVADLRTQNGDEHKRIDEFRSQTTATLERLETALKMQAELAAQIEALRSDIARLRGQVEVVTHAGETGEKRQRDFYLDLDGRLRKVETGLAEAQTKAAEAAAGALAAAKPKVDPAAETRLYEEALELFKAARYKEAHAAFASHVRDYPGGPLAPSAQFWLANALYVQQDCKGAIEAHTVVISKFPDSNKAADSMLAIASCQQDMKDAKGGRATLEKLVATYPRSTAADAARQRLKRK